MLQTIRPAIIMVALFTALLGIGYPYAILGIGQAVFPANANGSLVTRDGTVIGSSLIGQNFADPRYFWPRPSAAGGGHDPMSSSGSNLGPTSQKLADRIGASVEALRQQGIEGPVPADSVTASGSGLDPDISPEYARLQVARVAAARGLPPATIEGLVAAGTELPLLGFFGEPRVNVLQLNLALDAIAPATGTQ